MAREGREAGRGRNNLKRKLLGGGEEDDLVYLKTRKPAVSPGFSRGEQEKGGGRLSRGYHY